MKKFLLLLMLVPLFSWAQKTHKVGPKESLYSISRLYNVHPRDLAAYNNIPVESTLSIGQVLKIPTKKTLPPLPPVVTDDKNVPATEKTTKEKIADKKTTKIAEPDLLVPVYHIVQKKESLYQISRLYNKVPIDNLKKWNKLSSDALSEGTKLIVGYTSAKNKAEQTDLPVKKVEPVVEKKPEVVIEKPAPPKAIKKEEPVEPQVITNNNNFDKAGVFKTIFTSQDKESTRLQEEGQAGVFKSTSGWTDGKYYCLHNSAPPGTIIKITNTANGKSVFAKVLDIIPDIKQNSGLLIRVSNAAANELGAGETNFNCSINYSK